MLSKKDICEWLPEFNFAHDLPDCLVSVKKMPLMSMVKIETLVSLQLRSQ